MELEARVRLLEDERLIVRTLYRYGHAIDYGREEEWLDCFTDDAVWDARMRKAPEQSIRLIGRAQLAEYIASHTRPPTAHHKYLLVEPLIEIDGDEAVVQSYFVRLNANDNGPSTVHAMGRYRDAMVRGADGRWRFRERIVEIDDH